MGETLNQATLSLTVHVVLELTLKEVAPGSGITWRFAGLTVKVRFAPAWLTVTSTAGTSGAEIVICPVRGEVDVFCW